MRALAWYRLNRDRSRGLFDRVADMPDLETRMDDVRAVMDAAKSKDIKGLSDLTGKAAAALDKAAKSGTIHWKAAARKKSRLAAQVSKLTAAAK